MKTRTAASAGQITIRLHLPEPEPAADLRGLPTGMYLVVAEAAGGE